MPEIPKIDKSLIIRRFARDMQSPTVEPTKELSKVTLSFLTSVRQSAITFRGNRPARARRGGFIGRQIYGKPQ